MAKTYFITGTDTAVGKTYVTQNLLNAAKQQGFSALGLKPIAAGCEQTKAGWQNDDALALQSASTCKLSYVEINPFAFKDPISPHLAAKNSGEVVSATMLQEKINPLLKKDVNLLLIEGAGGWRVPINDTELFSDWVNLLQIPVIVVVGMRLGCLNHALLTFEAIRQDGLSIAGWVANSIDPEMKQLSENINYLQSKLPEPLLATFSYQLDNNPNNLVDLRSAIELLI